MTRRRKGAIVSVDEVKEITDADGRTHLVRRILGMDNLGNIIAEDATGRIITIKAARDPARAERREEGADQRGRGQMIAI